MAKHRNRERSKLRLFAAVVLAALALAALYQGGRWLEKRGEKPQTRGDYRQRYADDALFEYEGVSYRRRSHVMTLLVMGVDRASGEATGYRNGGQADFLRLIVIDAANRRISQVGIDRDTMTPITTLGVLGGRSGVRTAQIGLSHGFGDGREESCALTVEAVSHLLYQTPVDFYIAMNLDGIPVLNDSVGGVTVTLADDFSALDPSMKPGVTMTLAGEQAEIYVRGRRAIGVGTNEARMARQEQYVAQLMTRLDGLLREDKNYAGRLYDSLEPYLTTNLSRGRMINEVLLAKDYEREETIQLEGTHAVGRDGFMQFNVDEDALKRTVVKLFCEPVE